jgi:hypothetical protein
MRQMFNSISFEKGETKMMQERRFEENEVTNYAVVTTQRNAALAAGVSLLLMTAAAIFANFVYNGVLVPGDAAATAQNILANELQFRLAIISFLVVIVLDVIVAWGLYVFFRPVNRTLSLLAAWFRVVYAAVFLVTILNLGNALRLLHSGDTLVVLNTGQLQVQALLELNAFSDGWSFALSVFGLHLIVLGYLVFKAGYMAKILGALVIIAGLGYLFDSLTGFLFPSFSLAIGQFTFIGELLLALWLLIKGVKVEQREKHTQQPALA